MKWEQPQQMSLSEDYWGAWYLDLDEMLQRAESLGVVLVQEGKVKQLADIVRELHEKESQ